MNEKKEQRVAICPTREEDFAEWYQQIVKAADMAENSPVRGCMTIKPWGWAIWERIRDRLDARIKATGHENAYFPLFIPLSFLEREAAHVAGFAKECAIVTHHRLEAKDGKLVPVGELEEPLVVRPTSEVVIGEAFSRWVSSWRDLPLKINQWANVVRWEMRPRIFIRTTEFLWQEGHTAHASEKEAWDEAKLMLEEYKQIIEGFLAIPVIPGRKSAGERFPGAVDTMSLECMTQDRKAIQCATSHYLGQNFSKAFSIRFNNSNSQMEYAYTTSWGMTTRLIGALIMTHADDNGLCLPPKVAPYQVVIIPILTKDEQKVLNAAYALKAELEKRTFDGEKIRVHVDNRDMRAGEKSWAWIKKGVPIKIEIGPRDVDAESCAVTIRDTVGLSRNMETISFVLSTIESKLDEFESRLFERASQFLKQNTRTDIKSFEELRAFFTPQNEERPEIHGGFVLGKWSEDPASEEMLKELKITIRGLPLEQSGTQGTCIVTGKPATRDAIFSKAY